LYSICKAVIVLVRRGVDGLVVLAPGAAVFAASRVSWRVFSFVCFLRRGRLRVSAVQVGDEFWRRQWWWWWDATFLWRKHAAVWVASAPIRRGGPKYLTVWDADATHATGCLWNANVEHTFAGQQLWARSPRRGPSSYGSQWTLHGTRAGRP
jgi:hypothetical protein